MTHSLSKTRKLALIAGSATLFAAIGFSTAMAGVGDGQLTGAEQKIFSMPQGPVINHIGSYTPPRVNRACPTPRPQLSEEQQHRSQMGDVVIGVYVSSHGRAKKITVAKSSGFEDLDNAAAASAATWHYIPATMETAAVSGWTAVKFHFATDDNAQGHPAAANPASENCV